MDRNEYAFLNEDTRGEIIHTDDPERQPCRENFITVLVNGELKGKQLSPTNLWGRSRLT